MFGSVPTLTEPCNHSTDAYAMIFTNTIKTTLLFSWWKTETVLSYSISLVAIFILCILNQFLLSLWKPLPTSTKSSNSEYLPLGATHRRRIRIILNLLKTGVYLIQIAMSYMIMVMVMTLNVGVFVSAMLGLAVGFWLFLLQSDGEVLDRMN